MLNQEELLSILEYNQNTGIFVWKIKPSRAVNIGNVAGNVQKSGDGYVVIGYKGKIYRAHRLAWLYMTGVHPKHQIDHINGIRDDNRFINLREVTNQQNCMNRAIYKKKNTSGVKGVCYHKRLQKWQVNIRIDGVLLHLGYYSNIKDAEEVVTRKRKEIHGDYARQI